MREGACSCGAVRFAIGGPVRDVIVCHCNACIAATGGPWAASAAARKDVTVADDAALVWDSTAVSDHNARRGSCRSCSMVIFWDAPARETVSFSVDALTDASALQVIGHIWTKDGPSVAEGTYPEGLPASVVVPWRS